MSVYSVFYKVFSRPVHWLFRIYVIQPPRFPEGGFILCANHTSNADVLVLSQVCGGRQIRYMAKKELFSIPLVHGLITALGAYPINRQGADVTAIKKTIELLHAGEIVGIFPQGTRQAGKNPAETPVRGGVGMIALKAQVPIVPVFLKTEGHRTRFFCRTDVYFGEPIYPDSLPSGSGKEVYQQVAEQIFGEVCKLGAGE